MSADAALTVSEFCKLNNISKFSYFKMRKLGQGPVEMRPAGMSLVRITPQAHEEWRKRMEQLATTKEVKLEAARRTQQRMSK
jgi:hypothetical protein